ncbi:MAG: hypothetical protein BJ554DRAFT_2030 [Olpidium bornovanus]|uniref:Uncharacterized protein n=1 Tax=Olpidium bornovanus TaxID=278681 RepID=A0A8H8A183_9FUNG|nr:MAG: hypothetical protein BJ554DRAFT_2030 [Olpidium bornovanus]
MASSSCGTWNQGTRSSTCPTRSLACAAARSARSKRSCS